MRRSLQRHCLRKNRKDLHKTFFFSSSLYSFHGLFLLTWFFLSLVVCSFSPFPSSPVSLSSSPALVREITKRIFLLVTATELVSNLYKKMNTKDSWQRHFLVWTQQQSQEDARARMVGLVQHAAKWNVPSFVMGMVDV